MKIGEWNSKAWDMSGQVGPTFLVSRILTAAEAAAWIADPFSLFVDGTKRGSVYSKVPSTGAAGTVAALTGHVTRLYGMNAGTGSTEADRSGNGSAGTLGVATTWNTVAGEACIDLTAGGDVDIDCGTSPNTASTAGAIVVRFYPNSFTAGDRLFDDDGRRVWVGDTDGALRGSTDVGGGRGVVAFFCRR